MDTIVIFVKFEVDGHPHKVLTSQYTWSTLIYIGNDTVSQHKIIKSLISLNIVGLQGHLRL